MEFYDEDEIWKCNEHPSRRCRTGICNICLRERLSSLCPNCANERPCSCCATTTSSSSSSSSSSSLSLLSISGTEIATVGIGSVGRVSNLIESEPAFRRSRSLAIPPFLRPKPSGSREELRSSILSMFKFGKSKRQESEGNSKVSVDVEDERRMMMRKSRSVAVPVTTGCGFDEAKTAKVKGWHFPSPMKVFRQSRISKVVHQRSPLYRHRG